MRNGLIVALFLSSSTAVAADLLDILREAQTADSTYGAARAAWAATQERIPLGRAGLLPVATLSSLVRREDRTIQFRDPSRTTSASPFSSTGLTLSVTQPIFRIQNAIVYRQGETQVEQADAQLAQAAQEMILRTAQAYFDVLLAQDNVAFAEAQKTAIAQQLGQAKRNFEVGTAPVTDVHEAQARFDLTTAQEIGARNELALRRHALEQIIGREPPSLAPLGASFSFKPPEPMAVDPWLSLAAQNNLQVRAARSAVTLSGQEVERNRAAYLPTLDAVASLSNTGAGAGIQGGVGNDTRSKVVGLQLAWPLYSGGANSARVREALANEDRARQELETARRTAVFTARQAFLGITNGTALVRAFEAALVSTESQLSSTRVGQQVGVRTLVDVLNAQQLLFSARRDLAQGKYNYILSLIRLEAAIGELTEEDVVAVNQWLDRAARGAASFDNPATAVVSDRLELGPDVQENSKVQQPLGERLPSEALTAPADPPADSSRPAGTRQPDSVTPLVADVPPDLPSAAIPLLPSEPSMPDALTPADVGAGILTDAVRATAAAEDVVPLH